MDARTVAMILFFVYLATLIVLAVANWRANRPREYDGPRLPCRHHWIDPTNEYVQSNGYQICAKCGLLRLTHPDRPSMSE